MGPTHYRAYQSQTTSLYDKPKKLPPPRNAGVEKITRKFQQLALSKPNTTLAPPPSEDLSEFLIDTDVHYDPLLDAITQWSKKLKGLNECWREFKTAFEQFRTNWESYPHCHAEFGGRRPKPMTFSVQPRFAKPLHQKMWNTYLKFVDALATRPDQAMQYSPAPFPYTHAWDGQEWISGWTPMHTEEQV